MAGVFDLPVGPLADVSELLYVSALMQTSDGFDGEGGGLRQDASIEDRDISLFFMSRYGIKISPEAICELLLNDISVTHSDESTSQALDSSTVDTAAQDAQNLALSKILKSKYNIALNPNNVADLRNLLLKGESLSDDATSKIPSDDNDSPRADKLGENDAVIDDTTKTMRESSKSKIDIMEFVAILFIPQLLKQLDADENPEHKDELAKLAMVCPRLLQFVAGVIHGDVSRIQDHEIVDLEITTAFIREMLLRYGETALAKNETLLEEMVAAVKEEDESEPVIFNHKSFLRGLTADVQQYNVYNEGKLSSNWNDVFGSEAKRKSKYDNFSLVPTADSIDMSAHTYFCRFLMVLNWLFFVFTYFSYIFGSLPRFSDGCPDFNYFSTWRENENPFACSIGASILDWLIAFGMLCLAGIVFVGFGSLGNEIQKKHWGYNLFGLCFILGLMIYFPLTEGVTGEYSSTTFLRVITLVIGCLATLARLDLFYEFFNSSLYVEYRDKKFGTNQQNESLTKRAASHKLAKMQVNAIHVHGKVEKGNAIRSGYALALSNFAQLSPTFERVGGFLYTWKASRAKKLTGEHGLFFSGRHIAANVAQWILCIFVLGYGINLTTGIRNSWLPRNELDDRVTSSLEMVIKTVADNSVVKKSADNITQSIIMYVLRFLYFLDSAGLLRLDCIVLGSFLESFCLDQIFDVEEDEDDRDFACSLFASGPEEICASMEPFYRPQYGVISEDNLMGIFNTTSLLDPVSAFVAEAASENIAAQLNRIYPRTQAMAFMPFAVATAVTFLAAVYTTLIFFPSVTGTILKLRSGLIPTMRDPEQFEDYRLNVDKGTYLSGSMFWGLLVSSAIVGGIIGLIVFFFMWQVTAFYALQFTALIIGISLTVLVKWLLTRACRKKVYTGFYRNNPFVANLIELVNETFNFATSVAFAITRMTKLILLAATYVGRVDTQFMAKGVGNYFNGWIKLDVMPTFFIADVLTTEAHRHPYIESFGVLMLHKLKHGKTFISPAGSTWRLIFVYALMPWLGKYRKAARGEKTTIGPN